MLIIRIDNSFKKQSWVVNSKSNNPLINVMNLKTLNSSITYFIALIWLANGLFCKMLNLVPRHQEIVARILGYQHAGILTKTIGLSEIFMALWILSGIRARLNAITQIVIIAAMNTLEFFIVPDLLLWGKANAIFACIFILLIWYNEFQLRKK